MSTQTIESIMDSLQAIVRSEEDGDLNLQQVVQPLKFELQALETRCDSEVALLQQEYAVKLAKLKSEHEVAVNNVFVARQERICVLREMIQQAEANYSTQRKLFLEKSRALLVGITVDQVVQFIPERHRPQVIKAGVIINGRDVLLVKLANRDDAFLIYSDDKHNSTRHSLKLLPHSLLCTIRYLPCFCSAGCMDGNMREYFMAQISETCKINGIKRVFARKSWGSVNGVEFDDAEVIQQNLEKDRDLSRYVRL